MISKYEQFTEESVRLYNQGLGTVKISKRLGITSSVVYYLLKKQKVVFRKRSSYRKYSFNDNCFLQIDSEEKAYWLGFLIADGNIFRSSLRLEISSVDYLHLEKFKRFVNGNFLIKKTKKNCHRICLCSAKLVASVVQYGLVPNKSLRTFTPKIPGGLLKHFYRGVLDGDGWISYRKRNNYKGFEFGFSSGCEFFIKQIWDWMCAQLGYRCGYLIHRRKKNQQVFQLQMGGNSIFLDLVNLFYKDATVWLDRKHEVVVNAIDVINRQRLMASDRKRAWTDNDLKGIDWERQGSRLRFFRSMGIKTNGSDKEYYRYWACLKNDLLRLNNEKEN